MDFIRTSPATAAGIDQLPDVLWTALAQHPSVLLGLSRLDTDDAEPMTVRFDPASPDALYLFSRRDSSLVRQLQPGASAFAHFASPGHGLFAILRGSLTICADPRVVQRLWSAEIGQWYAGGRDDPTLVVLRMDLTGATLWSQRRPPEAVRDMFGVAEPSGVGADVQTQL